MNTTKTRCSQCSRLLRLPSDKIGIARCPSCGDMFNWVPRTQQPQPHAELLETNQVQRIPETIEFTQDDLKLKRASTNIYTILGLFVFLCLVGIVLFLVTAHFLASFICFVTFMGMGLVENKLPKTRPLERHYDMDSSKQLRYKNLCDSFSLCAQSRKSWSIRKEKKIARSAKSIIVNELDLIPLKISLETQGIVSSNVTYPTITVASITLFFMPHEVLLSNKDRFLSIKYSELTFDWATLNYAAPSHPPDAKISGGAWEHQNRDGSQDLRYASNRFLQTAQYSCLLISHRLFYVEIVLSRPSVTESLCKHLEVLKV
jgi:hypothetical protein